MARVLLRLEDNTFAAWGCGECAWIMLDGKESGKSALAVTEAFRKHECAKFPRFRPAQAKSRLTNSRQTQS